MLIKKSLHLLKCLQPKNPEFAENGLGWLAVKIKWFGLFSIGIKDLAWLPHSINTIGEFCSFKILTISRVKVCHNSFEWEAGLCSITVRLVFKSKTPCFAQGERSVESDISILRSAWISLKIFFRLGCGLPLWQLKASPSAWPLIWYGSWPMITTFTFFNGTKFSALKTFSLGGKTVWWAYSFSNQEWLHLR